MFAYEYLKQDPKTRDQQFKLDWQALFKDAPIGVKRELKEMEGVGIPINDATLFWHAQELEARIEHDYQVSMLRNRSRRRAVEVWVHISTMVYQSHWPVQLYTLWQNHPGCVLDCLQIMRALAYSPSLDDSYKHIECLSIRLPMNDVVKLVELWLNYFRVSTISDYQMICVAMVAMLTNARHLNKENAQLIMKYCEVDFVRRLNDTSKLNTAINLLRDIGSYDGLKFKSINEIERAHNANTAQEAQKIIETEDKISFVYTDELKAVVKENDFILPPNPTAMVVRGQQHSNCVATYRQQQTSFTVSNDDCVTYTIKRLFFTTTATLDIDFECINGTIVSTSVKQFKGRFNKNVELTKALIDRVNGLRLGLTGQSAYILQVKMTEDKHDND